MENTEKNITQEVSEEPIIKKNTWGGWRNGGRPKTDRTKSVTIRLTERHEALLRMQKNISVFIGDVLDFYIEQKGIEL